MSSGLASLHKILKDKTRSKTLLLLSEKGALGYTDLMDELGIVSTGMLNYHLKVLGDLLQKNEAGQYLLTERGKLASRLLLEFPEDNQSQKRLRLRQFWTVAAISQIVYLASVLTLYYLKYIEFGRLVLYTIMFVGSIGLAYLGYRTQTNMPKPGSEEERKRLKIGYAIAGGMLGLIIAFFGPLLVILASRLLGGPDLGHAEGGGELWVFLIIVGSIVGAISGYWCGRRNKFRKPKWAVWLEEKGFH